MPLRSAVRSTIQVEFSTSDLRMAKTLDLINSFEPHTARRLELEALLYKRLQQAAVAEAAQIRSTNA